MRRMLPAVLRGMKVVRGRHVVWFVARPGDRKPGLVIRDIVTRRTRPARPRHLQWFIVHLMDRKPCPVIRDEAGMRTIKRRPKALEPYHPQTISAAIWKMAREVLLDGFPADEKDYHPFSPWQ